MARADPGFPGGQLVGLHVLPSDWGTGIGSDLHDAALAVLSEAGYHDAGLWVIAGNTRARRMYERRGAWLTTNFRFGTLGEAGLVLRPAGFDGGRR
jgi:ribosomal protein S18 acetylase RimI-like enzyme